jgi:hypothetical protein
MEQICHNAVQQYTFNRTDDTADACLGLLRAFEEACISTPSDHSSRYKQHKVFASYAHGVFAPDENDYDGYDDDSLDMSFRPQTPLHQHESTSSSSNGDYLNNQCCEKVKSMVSSFSNLMLPSSLAAIF